MCVMFLRDGGAKLEVVAKADDTSTIAVRCHFRCCILTAELVLEVACAIIYFRSVSLLGHLKANLHTTQENNPLCWMSCSLKMGFSLGVLSIAN